MSDCVCHKCGERERIMASLPQDGSRGQKDQWDELLDKISRRDKKIAELEEEIKELEGKTLRELRKTELCRTARQGR